MIRICFNRLIHVYVQPEYGACIVFRHWVGTETWQSCNLDYHSPICPKIRTVSLDFFLFLTSGRSWGIPENFCRSMFQSKMAQRVNFDKNLVKNFGWCGVFTAIFSSLRTTFWGEPVSKEVTFFPDCFFFLFSLYQEIMAVPDYCII